MSKIAQMERKLHKQMKNTQMSESIEVQHAQERAETVAQRVHNLE